MVRRIIGLTGGIATGKSTVSECLATVHHLPVLDADIYAREAVEPDSPILTALTERYGENILLPDGHLDRSKLGEIIFNNANEKYWVEQQIHPFVRQRFQTVAETYSPTQTLVYAIPLLFEAKLTSLVSEIWVVTCSPEQQLERLMARNHLTLAQAKARIMSQMPLHEKIIRADVVLDNSGSQAALFSQISLLINSSE
ncbi:MAG: dephospho-CoA kinase [Cyanobacteria bacterium P01_A01_bin.114]